MTTTKNRGWWRAGHVFAIAITTGAATFAIWPFIQKLPAIFAVTDQTGTKAVEKLERIRQGYASAKSVHIAAVAKITLYGSNFRVGNGSYEYWAEGDRYRIKCHSDPQLGFLKDVDIAYDGKRFYYFDRSSSLLSYQHRDIPQTMGALPNPLFLPVDFLSAEDDSCPFCALKMSDFRSTNTRWSDRASRSAVKSQTKDKVTGRELIDLEMPGGIKAKRPFKILLRMAEAEDGKVHLVLINQVGLDQKLLTSMSFDHFMPTQLGEFPRTIISEGFDENSNLLFRMEYTVNILEVNSAVDETVFAVDFAEAERVWDSDARKFVKEGKSKPPKL